MKTSNETLQKALVDARATFKKCLQRVEKKPTTSNLNALAKIATVLQHITYAAMQREIY